MLDRVIAILTSILKIKIDEKSERKNILQWDSMQNLNIIMTLEEEFKIDIPMDCFKDLSSVKTIVEYLENQNVLEKRKSI